MSKTEVESCKKINIDWLLKKSKKYGKSPSGRITWTYGESNSSVGYKLDLLSDVKYLRLQYTQTKFSTGEKQEFDYKTYLVEIQCRYGGSRFYFLCNKCSRKVSTIYLSSSIFCCRSCNNLTYKSQNENRRNLLFSTVNLEWKNQEQLLKIKKWSYKGKLTRKARNFIKKQRKIEDAYPILFRK